MFYRENGQFKTSYRADQQNFPIIQDRLAVLFARSLVGPQGLEPWTKGL